MMIKILMIMIRITTIVVTNVEAKRHVTPKASHVTRNTSHITHHTSHITHHTSHITHHTPLTQHLDPTTIVGWQTMMMTAMMMMVILNLLEPNRKTLLNVRYCLMIWGLSDDLGFEWWFGVWVMIWGLSDDLGFGVQDWGFGNCSWQHKVWEFKWSLRVLNWVLEVKA